MRAHADAEGGVGGDFFGKHRGRDPVEPRAAILLRHAATQETDLSRCLEQLRHQALFVLLELGDERNDFLGDEFLGHLADQPLIVRQLGGREDVFGARRFQQKTATGRCGPRCCRRSHMPSFDRLRDALENARGSHAAADAHGNHAITCLAALKFAHNCGGKLRSGAAERVAQSDGAAIGIYPRGIETGKTNHGKRLRGEGFI